MSQVDSSPMARQPAVVLDEKAVQRENALLRELVTVYQHLTGLTLQDADVSTVLQLLARRTAATVAVVSRGLEVMAAAAPDVAEEDVARQVRDYVAARRLGTVLNSTAQTRRSLRLPDSGGSTGVIVAPILVGDDVPAYLMTFGSGEQRDLGDMSLLVTEHAATIWLRDCCSEPAMATARSAGGLATSATTRPASTGSWPLPSRPPAPLAR